MNNNQSTEPVNKPDHEEVVNLRELLDTIWDGKWFILTVAFVFSGLSAYYALTIPDEYKTTVLMSPSPSSGQPAGFGGAQFGGLASLAGINLGGGNGNNKVTIAIEIIKSWGFLEQFIKDNDLGAEVFAVQSWDRLANKLMFDSDIYDETKHKWLNSDGSEGGGPSSWQLFKSINSRINVAVDKVTGLVTLSVEHYSPYIAKEWADKLVKAINDHVKRQDRDDLLKSIQYLKEKVNETDISQMQSVFYQLIEEQTKALMLAEVSSEYVLKVLSPAKVVEEKSKPRRAIIVIVGFLVGTFLSIFFVLLRSLLKPLKNNGLFE